MSNNKPTLTISPNSNVSIEDISNQVKKYHVDRMEKDRALLSGLVSSLFSQYEGIKAIGWYQYVPSFNDGDPCTFLMGEFHFLVEAGKDDSEIGVEGDYWEESSYDGCRWAYRDKHLAKLLGESGDTISENLRSFCRAFCEMEDALENLFGHDCAVEIHRDGKIKVEDYECGY